MKKGNIVLYKRKNGKKALGKIDNINGNKILLSSIVDYDLNKMSGKFGSGKTTIFENDVIIFF